MEHLGLKFRIWFREVIETSSKMLLFLFSFSGFFCLVGWFFQGESKNASNAKNYLGVLQEKIIENVIKVRFM